MKSRVGGLRLIKSNSDQGKWWKRRYHRGCGRIGTYDASEKLFYTQVVLEVTGTQNVLYTYGDDLLSQERNSATNYFHYDGLGSTRALSDSSGSLTDSYDYAAFGEVLNQSGATENLYQFTGEQFDTDIDKIYLRARYYDQYVRRFTQQDTWEGLPDIPLSQNKYNYTEGDPVNNIDPSGRSLISVSFSGSIRENLSSLATANYLKLGATSAIKGSTKAIKAGAGYCIGQMIVSMIGADSQIPDKLEEAKREGCELNQMRVQLQQGSSHTNSKVAFALPRWGVSKNHLRARLKHLYYDRHVGGWFPSTMDKWMFDSIVKLSKKIGKVPSSGVSEGGTILTEQTTYKKKNYRIDIENLRGTNLRN